MTYAEFFTNATHRPPYGWQGRLAGGDCAAPEGRFAHSIACESRLISIPTGLGKTAGVVLAWLWNRLGRKPSAISASPTPAHPWPRRLVFCLPMRTLVEQTADNVRTWLGNLWQQRESLGLSEAAQAELLWLAGDGSAEHPAHSPVILMGGEELDPAHRDWDLYPEKPAILIGTQDMLLSRVLNRGYGMSRYRWPIHFALLNNDCLWVHDETQLMGVGLETSVQLAGFRERFGTLVPCVHWWMSATLDEHRLRTPEAASHADQLQLTAPEQQMPEVRRRMKAVKRLHRAGTSLIDDVAAYAKALADEVATSHAHRTLSLVIVNTVERAQAVFRELREQCPARPATLLHSRFRPAERQALVRRVLESVGDHIVVSTQVVEAGVDLSARTLFTELAPWSSLVQRFGRCHRHGEMADTGADIRWVNLPDAEAAPYATQDLAAARELLAGLTDASPAALALVTTPPVPQTPRHVIRPKDLRELFDTTPDIAGADLDISRFIRESEDSDCLVFWRAGIPQPDSDGPSRDELCPVPVGQLRDFADKQKDKAVWVWDALERAWSQPERFVPGRTYWLLSSIGGYDPELGFDRSRKKQSVTPVVRPPAPAPEGHDDERGTSLFLIETLEDHTTAVVTHTAQLIAALGLPTELRAALTLAAKWHDIGKAHPVFQASLRRANPALAESVLYAKSGTQARLVFEGRPHFRHELASALAFRTLAAATAADAALVAYLIAAHHGKVRLSIRSLPGEKEPPRPPDGSDPLYARGIWHGDTLLAFTLDGADWPETVLSLAPMQIGLGPDGQPSWLEACLALRDAPELGPCRLALLEALLRAADMRASALAPTPGPAHGLPSELADHHRPLAATPAGGQSPPALGEHPGARGPEHGVRGRAGQPADPPRDTRPEHATRFVETTRGVLSYRELAPLLAERVLAVQTDIERACYAARPLDESLPLEFHQRIAGELVPDWAGRWRTMEVRVGNLRPPAPHLVAPRMRDYCLDLQARLPDAAATLGDLTLEFLAFAEGRFLTVHPFPDFNGRVIRLFLSELLRRLDLPPVRLEAEGESERAAYFAALEAADQNNLRPLVTVWQRRLAGEYQTS